MKSLKKWIFQFVLISFITLCVFEFAYRHQIIDFYASGWQFLNKDLKEKPNAQKILVFGDSFSANQESWINQLNDDPNLKVYNAAIPGIGVETFDFILAPRINEVQPDHIIIQLYVGNDLYDLVKPVNWDAFSWSRNLFWSASNQFRSLNYLNYRAGQVSTDVVGTVNPKLQPVFKSELYSSRTHLYIQGDSNYPNDAIKLQGDSKELFDDLVQYLNAFRTEIDDSISIQVLIVPHCTQINSFYLDNYRSLNAKISNDVLNSNTWVKGIELDVIDPKLYFRSLDNENQRMYLVNDPHLSNQGQKELGKFVLNHLKIKP